MTDEAKYNVNFFRPLSAHAKANKKLILTLATIWAVAVFGFQFLIMALNEPTPEPAYNDFTSSWSEVAGEGQLNVDAQQTLARSVLSVLGKNIAVKDDHKAVLKTVLSWSVNSILIETNAEAFGYEGDAKYAAAAEAIGLGEGEFDEIMIDLLPTSLVMVEPRLPEDVQKSLPEIMELYLVHNRSALTDTTFLGFPFHYWYTAQFLLILFVVLCLVYARVTDKMNVKHEFVETT